MSSSTHQHFGETPLQLDRVRHRLSRRAAHAAAACVRSAQAAHAQAGLTRVMRHAGLDTTDEYLADTAIALAAAALHDSHIFVGFAHARAFVSRRYAIPRDFPRNSRCDFSQPLLLQLATQRRRRLDVKDRASAIDAIDAIVRDTRTSTYVHNTHTYTTLVTRRTYTLGKRQQRVRTRYILHLQRSRPGAAL